MIARMLLVMEVSIDQPEGARDEMIRRLDAFREAVRPELEYGITFYIAGKDDIEELARQNNLQLELGEEEHDVRTCYEG